MLNTDKLVKTAAQVRAPMVERMHQTLDANGDMDTLQDVDRLTDPGHRPRI